jgi:LysM repeat protein
MPVASVTGAEGMGQKATSRNKPQTVNETEKRYDYISYYDPVIGHQIASSLTVTVNRGNTLWDIINHQYGDLSGPEMADKIEQIKKINKLTDPNKLSVGQDLVLPDPDLKLGKNYINKCRNTNYKPNVCTTFAERQAVVIRQAKPEEIPNQPFIKSYNPELGTVKFNVKGSRQSYWVAKTEDDATFQAGSQQRQEIYKRDLSNLFNSGTGVGDVVGIVSGAAIRNSRHLVTVKPYLTRGGASKYRIPLGKLGNKNKAYPKGLPVGASEFRARYLKVNFKSTAALNAAASIIDAVFEGLHTGDWGKASFNAVKSFGEGIAVSYASSAITAYIVTSLVELSLGPPGWVVLAVNLVVGAGLTFGVNYLDSIVFR